MYHDLFRSTMRFFATVIALGSLLAAHAVQAQVQPPQAPQAPPSTSPKFRVINASERLEMIVNTSRILEMEFKVPRMLVNNPDIVQATPLSPNEVQLSALRPGVTNLNLWDDQGKIHTVDVLVIGDARELKALLESEFPEASLRITPLSNSVVVSGFVPSPDMVSRIVTMAEDYYPNVINNLSVGGAQTVLLQVKVMEVSRTKLRRLGFDWAYFNGDDSFVQNVTGVLTGLTLVPGSQSVTTALGETFAFGVVDTQNAFFGFLDALRQYNLVKVLAEPNLVTVSGRPASFNSGGEFPILIPQSLGTIGIEFREFGTRVDFVPIVLGNGNLRLEVRPEISEIDPARSVTLGNISVPGLRNRWVDTAVEMRAGQTLALAGLIQVREDAQNRGFPLLADLPWVGAAFRRVESTENEIELLILVTPEFVDAVDAHEFPPCGPGQFTAAPTDVQLYAKGYLEVPARCAPNCGDGCNPGSTSESHSESHSESAPVQIRRVPENTSRPAGVLQRMSTTRRSNARSEDRKDRAISTEEPPTIIGPVGYEAIE